jgi:hypothetical protein
MHHEGRTCQALAPESLCYQRHGIGHAWPVTDLELRGAWDVEFRDLGVFDTRIVDGVIPRPEGESLGVMPFDLDNFMPARLLREQLTTP